MRIDNNAANTNKMSARCRGAHVIGGGGSRIGNVWKVAITNDHFDEDCFEVVSTRLKPGVFPTTSVDVVQKEVLNKKVSNKLSRMTNNINLKTILNGFQNCFYLFFSLILTGETGL